MILVDSSAWIDFFTGRISRETDELDRLLGREPLLTGDLILAEVLQGEKPANLVPLANKRRSCGRNLYELWGKYGAGLIRESGLAVKELVLCDDYVLLLVYHRDVLGSLLSLKKVAAVLLKAGYREPADTSKALDELVARGFVRSRSPGTTRRWLHGPALTMWDLRSSLVE